MILVGLVLPTYQHSPHDRDVNVDKEFRYRPDSYAVIPQYPAAPRLRIVAHGFGVYPYTNLF